MEKLELIQPNKSYEKQAIEYIQEFYKYNSNINGVGGLYRYLDNYDAWLKKLEEDRTRKMTEEKVPAETYFLVRKRDNKIVGMINIRLQLNEKLKAFGGNIGYSIRPTERRKGYNKINLYLALQICQKHKIKEVMLDCDKDNLGSAKTMQALVGKLTKEYYDENVKCLVQQYVIDVNESVEKYKNFYLHV